GDIKINNWGNQVQTALKAKKWKIAIDLLSEKPGYLLRSIDQIARNVSTEQFNHLLRNVKKNAKRVSGRVLLNVIEHLDNRQQDIERRIFVNKNGRGFVKNESFEALSKTKIDKIQKVLWNELGSRIPEIPALAIDKGINGVAVPLSEKNKSEG